MRFDLTKSVESAIEVPAVLVSGPGLDANVPVIDAVSLSALYRVKGLRWSEGKVVWSFDGVNVFPWSLKLNLAPGPNSRLPV
jgi:hypothetical protein